MTDAVLIPIKMVMDTDTGEYQISSIQVVFAANGVPVCQASLAVGRNQNGDVQTINLKRAERARVFVSGANITASNSPFGVPPADGNNYFYLADDQFLLFDGIVDDFGPGNLTAGQFDITVRLVGKLGWLASGTLSSSNLMPCSYWDTNVQYAFGEAGQDPVFMDYTKTRANFWTGLQEALVRVATRAIPNDAPQATIAKIVQQVFGGGVNQRATDVLATVVGPLMGWNTDRTDEEIGALVFNLNQYLATEWAYEPFLNRICAIGEMLQLAIIETGQGIKVVPYTPFFKRADAYPIGPETYVSATQPLAPYRNIAGVMLVDGAGRDAGAPSVGAEVVGLYKSLGNPLGQVHVTQLPGYIGKLVEDAITGGDKVRAFVSAANGTAAAMGAGTNANAFLTNLLAKYMTWDLNYNARHVQVVCPFFRSDIGPLTAVRVDYPATAEIAEALESPAVYGSVQQVSIQIDATRGFAQTTYDIGYCRSYNQQKFQIDPAIESTNEHPFFQTNYIGGRLDSIQNRSHTVA